MTDLRFPDGAESSIAFPEYASSQAIQAFTESLAVPKPSLDDGIEQLRAFYDDIDRARVNQALSRFGVDYGPEEIAGVPVQIVTPREGVPQRNAQRILVNVHGGAFMWGRGNGSLTESIPIAATGSFKVVTVHYRLAPEHRFPAASKDVAAVYAKLLDQYHPHSIGMYGTSAGGILTAQVIACLHREGLPFPGAIGTFCGTGLEIGGDSLHLSPFLAEKPPVSDEGPSFRVASLPYFRGASADDPLVFPLEHDDWVRVFPPTLLITGSRDYAASSLTLAHRKLSAAGRHSQLFVFDGLWHAFLVNPELPESSEAYSLISRFFTKHLR